MLVGIFAGLASDSFTSGTMISCARIWGATLEERKGFSRTYLESMVLGITLNFTPKKTRPWVSTPVAVILSIFSDLTITIILVE
jgi:hypothetical protein